MHSRERAVIKLRNDHEKELWIRMYVAQQPGIKNSEKFAITYADNAVVIFRDRVELDR